MPEYSFSCKSCFKPFNVVWRIIEYDKRLEKAKCPYCGSKNIFRRYEDDRITINYIPNLSECKTVGQYAEKQTKIYGKEKCAKMAESFKTKPEGGMTELPDGMSRPQTVDDLKPYLPREEAKKRGKKK